MLRPPTALFCTVMSVVKYGANRLPQPIGQVLAFIIVESPAIHTLIFGSAAARVLVVDSAQSADDGRPVVAAWAVGTPRLPVSRVAASATRKVFIGDAPASIGGSGGVQGRGDDRAELVGDGQVALVVRVHRVAQSVRREPAGGVHV